MKKFLILGLTLSATLAVSALTTFAATTATVLPGTVNTAPGGEIIVSINVNPNGTANYAEKVEVLYPTDILDFVAFTPASGWTSISQPEYDSVNESTGSMIKTAGYPNGITTATVFGTVTFRVVKAGTGTVKIGPASQAFEASNQPAISGAGTASIISVAATTPKAPAATPKVTPAASVAGTAVATTTSTSTPEIIPAPVVNTPLQQAAVAESEPNSTSVWYWIGGVLIALIIAVFVLRRRRVL